MFITALERTKYLQTPLVDLPDLVLCNSKTALIQIADIDLKVIKKHLTMMTNPHFYKS